LLLCNPVQRLAFGEDSPVGFVGILDRSLLAGDCRITVEHQGSPFAVFEFNGSRIRKFRAVVQEDDREEANEIIVT